MEITETIDSDDMTRDEQVELAISMVNEVNRHLSLQSDAVLGDIEPQTFTEAYVGDEPSEALGKGYALRDHIEANTERSVSCELTGTRYLMGGNSLYEVEVVIE